MQTLVLVAGMSPRVDKWGPNVLLAEGKWKIVAEDLKDSTLSLRSSLYEGTVEVSHGTLFKSEKGNSFSLKITKPGSEEYLTVFAEQVQ